MYIHVHILKIYTICVYLYIQNKYTQYTLIYDLNKNVYFGCDLIAINHLTALIKIRLGQTQLNFSLENTFFCFVFYLEWSIVHYNTNTNY